MDPFLPMLEGGQMGGWLDPEVPPLPPQFAGMNTPPPPPVGGQAPEAIAAFLARSGVGPEGVIQSAKTGGFPAPGMGSVGAALEPAAPAPGAPLDLSPPAPGAASPPPAGPGMQTKLGNLATAMKGVQAPPAPQQQRISTPSVPGPRGQVKGGNIMALLAALGSAQPQIPSLASAVRG